MLVLADSGLWAIVSIASVVFILGVVLYGLVRPFTHRNYVPGRWEHLP